MLTKKTIRSLGNAAGRVPLAKREARRLVRWLCPDGDPRLVQALMHKGLSALSGEALERIAEVPPTDMAWADLRAAVDLLLLARSGAGSGSTMSLRHRAEREWSALRAEFGRAGSDAVPNGYDDDILDEAGLSPDASAEEVRRALVRVLVADPGTEEWVRQAVADFDDHGQELATRLTAADCQELRTVWAEAWAATATHHYAMAELERRARETFVELRAEAMDLLTDAESLGEGDALNHLKCAETVETIEALVAQLNEAAETAHSPSIATACRTLAAKCQQARVGKTGEHDAQRGEHDAQP